MQHIPKSRKPPATDVVETKLASSHSFAVFVVENLSPSSCKQVRLRQMGKLHFHFLVVILIDATRYTGQFNQI